MLTIRRPVMAPEDDAGNGGNDDDKSQDQKPGDKPDDGSGEGKTYNQKSVDGIADAVRKTEREAAKIRTEEAVSAALKKAGLTGAEKEVADAVEKTDGKWKKEFDHQDTRHAASLKLMTAGVRPDKIEHVLAIVNTLNPEASADEFVKIAKAEAAEFFGEKGHKLGPSDGRNADEGGKKPGTKWDGPTVEKALTGKTPQEQAEWWLENGDEVKADQASRAPIRIVLPGRRMYERPTK